MVGIFQYPESPSSFVHQYEALHHLLRQARDVDFMTVLCCFPTAPPDKSAECLVYVAVLWNIPAFHRIRYYHVGSKSREQLLTPQLLSLKFTHSHWPDQKGIPQGEILNPSKERQIRCWLSTYESSLLGFVSSWSPHSNLPCYLKFSAATSAGQLAVRAMPQTTVWASGSGIVCITRQ